MLGRQMLLVGGETENVPLYYHMYDNFQIQFGREEFCLVTGLKFGVEYSADYDDEDKPILFRRRVFSSCLDGILQLVLLGVQDRRTVPNWILRLENDRDGWDDYPRGSHVWPTLYYQLRDANVKHWLPLYATEPTNEDDNKSYSIFGFTWAFKGRVPAEILIPDEVEAGSDFQEQRSGLDQMMKQGQNIFDSMKKYMEDLNVGTGANREPIIVDQHYGISDLSIFQSIQGGPSSFQTPTNHSFFNMGTPINWQTPRPSSRPSPRPSQPGSSNWQSQMPAYTPSPSWKLPIPSHHGDASLCDPRPRREQHPSVYMQSPYTPLPPTTELPKKRVGITKKKCKNDNLSPLNLRNAFAYNNAGGDDVVITGVHDTVPEFFWRQLVPHLCMPRSHSLDNPNNEGWLSGDQMNAWIEILIRSRPQDADWTVSKSGTTCVHNENNQFMIQTDPHIIGTLDGSTRPYPSWKNINWVYMPINVGGNH
ncbi:hypothetical protein Tco_0955028 [Tanacetum coccineum]|uniref:Uncharacterized protein n=1 Tax=Tanacetum coccineum TaxID=301880 RepID=A0ABQ5E657_9ASTR